MKSNSSDKILAIIAENGEVSPKELQAKLGISVQALFRHLKKLINSNQIIKLGSSPKVYYRINEAYRYNQSPDSNFLANDQSEISSKISENFLYVSSSGNILPGISGFIEWCLQRNLNVEKTAKDYVNLLTKYENYKKRGYISGYEKIKSTFAETYLDEIYYYDFYAIEIFGKTKLGQLVLFAKTHQSMKTIQEISLLVSNSINKLIRDERIDAVGFIPPSLPRKVQLMKELPKYLNLNIPSIDIVKVKNDVTITQKSLKKLEDRIINARDTIFINDSRKFKNVLLIDDAVGSGATLNETAKKLKEKGTAESKVIGFGLVGSIKGFDVISEV